MEINPNFVQNILDFEQNLDPKSKKIDSISGFCKKDWSLIQVFLDYCKITKTWPL